MLPFTEMWPLPLSRCQLRFSSLNSAPRQFFSGLAKITKKLQRPWKRFDLHVAWGLPLTQGLRCSWPLRSLDKHARAPDCLTLAQSWCICREGAAGRRVCLCDQPIFQARLRSWLPSVNLHRSSLQPVLIETGNTTWCCLDDSCHTVYRWRVGACRLRL